MSRGDMDPAVALFVLNRDAGCVAIRLGGTSMDCFGRNRLEHVQQDYGRMGRRAPSCPCCLATLCEGHTEPGMKAGHVWATDKANRDALRTLLATFGYGPHHDGHAGEILTRAEHERCVDPCSPVCPARVAS